MYIFNKSEKNSILKKKQFENCKMFEKNYLNNGPYHKINLYWLLNKFEQFFFHEYRVYRFNKSFFIAYICSLKIFTIHIN